MFRSLTLLAALAFPTSFAQDCGAELTNDAPDFEADPIKILEQNTDTVTFSVSQTFQDDLLCLIGVYYESDQGYECPGTANAAAGEFAQYTAVCTNGVAFVDLYVYDPVLLDNPEAIALPSICEGTPLEKTYKYSFSIPCTTVGSCGPPESVACLDIGDTEYDFEDSGDVQAWLFGMSGHDNGNHFLQLDAQLPEVSTTVEVPSDTVGLSFELEFLTISPLADDQKVLVRAGDYYLNVTAALSLPMASGKTEYYGEIEVYFEKLGFSDTIKATVHVPASLYSSGYISLGVRTTGSSDTFVAGVDNVKVNLLCDGTKNSGGGGDPHFQRWGREHSSFHGECDLVLISSDDFHSGAGLDLHVRTTIQDYFSYIETAALRVGESVLEFHKDHFYLDGTKHAVSDLPLTFGGKYSYTVTSPPIEEGKNPRFYQYFQVDLHKDSTILFKFYKKYLTISVDGHAKDFVNSVGLLGDYRTGNMLSRDGAVMTDFDQYGFEWQVNPNDAKLFLDARAPQLPYEECRMPTAARPARRRLRTSALFDEAKAACAHVTGSDGDLCIEDVLATGDVGLASFW